MGSTFKPKHSLIETESLPLRILITDCPPSAALLAEFYVPVFAELGVSHVIRLCEPTYDPQILSDAGVVVVDSMAFQDGTAPPQNIVTEYRAFIETILEKSQSTPAPGTSDSLNAMPRNYRNTTSTHQKPTIAVHCTSGIGRAPIFAVIPLIDFGMDRVEAVEFVRAKRCGAFNRIQIDWIMDERAGLAPKKKKQIPSLEDFFGTNSGGSNHNILRHSVGNNRGSVPSVSSNNISVGQKSGSLFSGLFGKKI
ncbi:Protein tyrosine phosphatase type IVA 1 [Physocladia obscura]|uniref:Protein tyrosine phosphatase type IVA 1 n=1 Tax=Physocladia obscura TaxID=109957 RepID=A0AAD5T252_9FUNG|nr:Protein tyrosine phosphatase type IVA 1 [Physocladia obscura]